ncbi:MULTISPECIES: hypothetical protein [Thermodesulfovibrio]|jgi:hypothetical protein|uniref:hypothetical protein n=1 Tax=Thermodesulfovibrio TaxID=28261 RepID=UPI00261AF3BB|nr:hypothetical protein [Thermodesulfovibrio sp.]
MRYGEDFRIVKVIDKNDNIIAEGTRLDCFRQISFMLTGKVCEESGYADLDQICKANGYRIEILENDYENKDERYLTAENSCFESNISIEDLIDEAKLLELKLDIEDSCGNMPLGNESNIIKIIMPDSIGYDPNKDKRFFIEGVFFSPKYNKVAYRGVYINNPDNFEIEESTIILPFDSLNFINEKSIVGTYNIETGEIKVVKENHGV